MIFSDESVDFRGRDFYREKNKSDCLSIDKRRLAMKIHRIFGSELCVFVRVMRIRNERK